MATPKMNDTLPIEEGHASERIVRGGLEHDELAVQPGDRISHNIRVIQRLGAGGMGQVWLADHVGLDTQVAVKFMTKELASDPSVVARFAREAKLVARIKSPHVVQIFDFATTPTGIPFIVMELLEGQSLETKIRERGISLEETSRILVQLLKALGRAHALGIVHRDIKPDNVFLIDHDGDTFAKLLDFGIARDDLEGPGLTVSGTTMGTPSYMSPEQLFRPKEVDVRSDLWSIAVVAYQCLTGQLPFNGDSFGAICLAINDGEFVPPSQLNSMLPPALDEWFERALRRDPVNRFQNVTEMANAYLAVLDRASLLPHWAEARHARGAEPIYDTDPGGLSGPLFSSRHPVRDVRSPWGTVAMCLALLVAGLVGGGAGAVAERGKWGDAWMPSRLWAEWVMPNVKLHVDPAVRETPKDDGPYLLPPAARNGALSETPRAQDPARPQDLGPPQGSAEPKIPQPPISPARRPADVDVAPRAPSLPAPSPRPAEPFRTEPREESPYDKTPYEVTPPEPTTPVPSRERVPATSPSSTTAIQFGL